MFRYIIIIVLFFSFSGPAFPRGTDEDFIDLVKSGDLDGVELLLANGHDPNAMDWAGWSALAWAALLMKNQIIESLVLAGADIDYISPGGKNSGTPLMMAAKKHLGYDSVKKLIDLGANINATDQYGRTALWMAARHGRLGIVKLLLLNGADATHRNFYESGTSAVEIARTRGYLKIVELLERGRKPHHD